MQAARQLVDRGARQFQVSKARVIRSKSAQVPSEGQFFYGGGSCSNRCGAGLSSVSIVRFISSEVAKTPDVFAEKYTPVFGSHLGKVLDRPAVHDDTGSYNYAEVYRLAGAIRDQIVNKVGMSRLLYFTSLCYNDCTMD